MDRVENDIIIDLEPISRRVQFPPDMNLYDVLLKVGLQVRALCGGQGTCGKCKVWIQDGSEILNEPILAEKKFLNTEELESGWRLACQTRLNVKKIQAMDVGKTLMLRVYLPEELLLEDFKILTSGKMESIQLNPNIRKFHVKVPLPSLEKPVADFKRLIGSDALNGLGHISIEMELLNDLPGILRDNSHELTITLWNEGKIIALEPRDTTEINFGIAFDIGTTTLVGYLINLNDGRVHAVSSGLNPQTAFGEDVVTRMSYIQENEDGLQKLNSIVIDALNKIISRTCSKAGISSSQVYEATFVGNSVMHHIFLGLNPTTIGMSPYVPTIQRSLTVKSKDLGLNIAHQGRIYTPPIIAGFVGADTMGVILSSHIEREEEITLAIDIGTNGEIIIGNYDSLATGSCAAGSALEGAHMGCGMRAAAGSIDSVTIEPESLEVSFTSIKDKKPIGICGSGLIDLVAEMLKANILRRNGGFNKDLIKTHDNVVRRGNIPEFIVVRKEDTNLGKDITISQDDIRQLQMAKGAFYSGTELILKYMKLDGSNELERIKQVFLAGAFGNYINKNNAKFIGMIPDIPSERIHQIGNAAGIGAQYCLLNKDYRLRAQEYIDQGKIQYVEISTKKEFQRSYAEAMYFPHLKLERFPSLKEYDDMTLR